MCVCVFVRIVYNYIAIKIRSYQFMKNTLKLNLSNQIIFV